MNKFANWEARFPGLRELLQKLRPPRQTAPPLRPLEVTQCWKHATRRCIDRGLVGIGMSMRGIKRNLTTVNSADDIASLSSTQLAFRLRRAQANVAGLSDALSTEHEMIQKMQIELKARDFENEYARLNLVNMLR